MKNEIHTTDSSEAALDLFEGQNVPSLNDILREFEEIENAQAAAFSSAPETSLQRLEREKNELQTALGEITTNFDKYRWRVERERAENYAFAVINLVCQFLPILDNFGRALTNARNIPAGQDCEQFVRGVELIYQQAEDSLSKIGVAPVAGVGAPFNPRVHEAVELESNSDVPPNTVTAEIVRGYALGEKLIRPAMVKVSQ